MTYDAFPIGAMLSWVEATAPDLMKTIHPAPDDQMEAFEDLFEVPPTDQALEVLEDIGGENALPHSKSWIMDIDTVLAGYAARPWLAEEDVAEMLIYLGVKRDAQQYSLFLEGPFAMGRSGRLVAMESLSKEAARDWEARPDWTVAGSLAEFICQPVFMERVISANDQEPTRWQGAFGQGSVLEGAREALEKRGFVAEPFSSDHAAALRRDGAAVALQEQSYPLWAYASGDADALGEIAAALSSAGKFEQV